MHRTWTALRLWINEQESSELRSGRPVALTPLQRHAISVLVPDAPIPASASVSGTQGSAPAPTPAPAPVAAPRTGPEVDPDFDREPDWVSKLFRYTQENGYPPAELDAKARDIPPNINLKWEPVCTVPNLKATFPNEEYGFRGGESPCFSTKKEAKKYAAMYAMRCINDALSRPRQSAPSPPLAHNPTAHQPTTSGSQEPAENAYGVRLTQDGPAAAPSGSDTDRAAPLSSRKKVWLDDEPDALRQVPELCSRLGMTTPQFKATPHESDSNLFNARPVFPDAFIEQVPGSLGVVTGLLTKGTAREASAVEVLVWLKEKERERDGEFIGLSAC